MGAQKSIMDCVDLGAVDNRYIRYIGGEITAVSKEEEVLGFFDMLEREMERQGIPKREIQGALAKSHSIEQRGATGDTKTASRVIMIDEGAATTCVSGDLVRSLGLEVRYDQRGLILAGFQAENTQGPSRDGVKYVVMILNIQGSHRATSEPVRHKILIIALVVEGLAYPMLFGGNMIARHAIKDDDENEAYLTMFRGDRMMQIPKIRWDTVEQRIKSAHRRICTAIPQEVSHPMPNGGTVPIMVVSAFESIDSDHEDILGSYEHIPSLVYDDSDSELGEELHMLDVDPYSSDDSHDVDSDEDDCPDLAGSDSDSDDDDEGPFSPMCRNTLTGDGNNKENQATISQEMPIAMTISATYEARKANHKSRNRAVKVHKYTCAEEEKLLKAVNAVKDYPVSVLQHYKNFPVCSEYQVKAITELAQEESEILPGLLGHLVAINLREEDAKRQLGHTNRVKQMSQEEAVDMVAAYIHSIGWSYATGVGSPHHFDVAYD